MDKGKIAIVGHGINTTALVNELRLKQLLEESGREVVLITPDAMPQELPQSLGIIEYKRRPQLRTLEEKTKPTCKRNHEYMKDKDGNWCCRFCSHPL